MQMLAGPGGPYAPGTGAVVREELDEDGRREEAEQWRRQEQRTADRAEELVRLVGLAASIAAC
ncbi:hypothetical protein [Streptomyces alfalfae]